MITPQNVIRHELVGLQVKVAHSSHRESIGIEGRVVNETKNTITLEDGAGNEKTIPKGSATFLFKLPDGSIVEINGKIIVSRPENRIKKKFRKYW
jgi:ribonuclease P protein subunit POP4